MKNGLSPRWIWYVRCIYIVWFQWNTINDVVKGATLIYLILHKHTMQMFFLIVFENHWVLLCVSMFMKQIAFFDSLSASKESTCLKHPQNLVSGFLAVSCVFLGVSSSFLLLVVAHSFHLCWNSSWLPVATYLWFLV